MAKFDLKPVIIVTAVNESGQTVAVSNKPFPTAKAARTAVENDKFPYIASGCFIVFKEAFVRVKAKAKTKAKSPAKPPAGNAKGQGAS